jgi:hypothetical protein
MRFSYLIAVLFCCTLFSCSKKDSPPKISFVVNNVQDVTLPFGSPAYLALEIALSSGPQEPVALSLSGLPAGVIAGFSAASGTPTFSSVITFTGSSQVVAGNHNIKLTATSTSGVTKTYDFVLHTQQGPSCIPYAVGSYNAQVGCGGAPTAYTCMVDSTGYNKVTIHNFGNRTPQIDVIAELDCSSFLNLVIPSQTIGGLTISGHGDFYPGSMSIQYTIVSGSGTESCTLYMN